jgi:hypothetical protein
MDIPIVRSYKYLGLMVATRKADVIKDAWSSIKKYSFLLSKNLKRLDP